MQKRILTIYKEVMKNLDEVLNTNYVDITIDVYRPEYFLDYESNSTILTFEELVHIEFQDKRKINNLLGNKRMRYVSFLDYFNNFKKEVRYVELNNNYKKFLQANILGLEYLVMFVEKLANKDRMLQYYVLFYLRLMYKLTKSCGIKWETEKLLNELIS